MDHGFCKMSTHSWYGEALRYLLLSLPQVTKQSSRHGLGSGEGRLIRGGVGLDRDGLGSRRFAVRQYSVHIGINFRGRVRGWQLGRTHQAGSYVVQDLRLGRMPGLVILSE